MPTEPTNPRLRGLARVLGWRRIQIALGSSALLGLIVSPSYTGLSLIEVLGRFLSLGVVCLLSFGLFERWPKRLPRWLARWVLQVIGVAVVIPFTALAIYLAVTQGDAMPLWKNNDRLGGMAKLAMVGLLTAPWITVAALFRQRDFAAHSQALAFELERSELERQALDSRLRLLQAQVEPHFLFNTLANLRELVDSGSPQAATVLDHLIGYLRAAVPRLHEPATTIGQEMQLVRDYLALMHMRMPDRLQFSLQVDQLALNLQCPPMMLLTLVENAVRHGIDPCEEGGRIDVQVRLRDGRCHAEVSDTGVGLRSSAGEGLGTGLSTLRERLQLVFAGDAQLRLASLAPHGVRAELDFPARETLS
ncbi:sensor histidine kinase [Nevskia ramosa]|uniref:sensor histidine kinase n=1 Tax=Nevskia ramosa TaxID=64002 RepID=UPI00048C2591|nr:histidine kinase [Nevskia ramosa]